MLRNLLLIGVVTLSVAAQFGCTSHAGDSADASDNPEESLDADGGGSSAAADDSAVADLGDDSSANTADNLSPDEKLPDDSATAGNAKDELSLDGDAKDQASLDGDAPPADAAVPPADAQAAPPAAEPAPEPVVPPADQQASNDAPPPAPPAEVVPAPAPTPEPAAPPEPSAAPAQASLKKVPTAAYQQGKTWVNAVYIARQNDDPKAISQKIYGSEDHVKQICRINSYNCSRTTKVGDKFYYNSPKRPDDHESLKVFYEDAGVPAETYVAKEGDNIHAVGKNLLGHDRSWMELWATNQDVESKGDLPAGTQIKYWPNSDAAPSQTMARNEGADKKGDDLGMEEGANAAPPQPDAPPPPPDQANNNVPPPAAATTAPPPPEVAPPPPPPPAPPAAPLENKHQAAPAAADSAMDDPNQTMALGVGAILLLAAVFLVISIRKKRRNKIDYNTATQTQIDT